MRIPPVGLIDHPWALLLALAPTLCAMESPSPVHVGTKVLHAGSMTVEVMDPNAAAPYYTGIRFCPSALVLRAVWKGHEFLSNPVPHNPTTEPAGLPNEFDIFGDPPGFTAAAGGGRYLKVGVGVLERMPDETFYRFWEPHRVVEADAVTVAWSDSGARFTQQSGVVKGYAYQIVADLSIFPDGLAVEWHLTNRGSETLATEQYNHNMFRFDDQTPVPGIVVEKGNFTNLATRAVDTESVNKHVSMTARGIRISSLPDASSSLNLFLVPAWEETESPVVSVRTPDGLSISEEVAGLNVARTALHVSHHYVCPEQFVRVQVEPGATVSWTRRWTVSQMEPSGHDP